MNTAQSSDRLWFAFTILALVVGMLIVAFFWFFYLAVAGNMGFGRWSGGLPFIALTAIEMGAMAVFLAQSFYRRLGARRIVGRIAAGAWALSCINLFLQFAVLRFY